MRTSWLVESFRMYSKDYLGILGKEAKSQAVEGTLFQRYRAAIRRLGNRLFDRKRREKNRFKLDSCLPETPLIIVGTSNNLNCVRFLRNQEVNILWVSPEGFDGKEEGVVYLSQLGKVQDVILDVIRLVFCTPFKGQSLKVLKYPSLWMNLVGTAGFYEEVIKEIKPTCVLFTNDHTPWHRIGIHVANELDVETMYLQHAAVSEYFPPLIVNRALLEGEDSWEKYKKIGYDKEAVEVSLVGIPKLDEYSVRTAQNTGRKLMGLATNMFDPIEEVSILCEELLALGYDVVVRPHPRDNREYPEKVSVNRESSSLPFLDKVDFLIAGSSSIQLDAAMMSVPAVCYNLGEGPIDYYKFVEAGLVKSVTSASEAIRVLENWTMPEERVIRKYNAVFGKPEGYASDLVKKTLGLTSASI